MVTAPLFVVLLLVTVLCVKGGLVKTGAVLLGVLLGLTLATTEIGPPIMNGLTAATSAVTDSITKAVGR
jgi:hypothetical protein